jgi:adenylate cyclase class 2
MTRTYEVEIKIPIRDTKSVRETILAKGGTELNSEVQTDTYFAHPCRSFEETDEALRVRSRDNITDENLSPHYAHVELTYKGPKVDSTTKTREEYSIGLAESQIVTQILDKLSFEQVATVTKHRTFFKLDEITLSVDDVEDVGTFIELEAIASGEEEMTKQRDKIIEMVRQIGLDPIESVRESYLELLLAKNK